MIRGSAMLSLMLPVVNSVWACSTAFDIRLGLSVQNAIGWVAVDGARLSPHSFSQLLTSSWKNGGSAQNALTSYRFMASATAASTAP